MNCQCLKLESLDPLYIHALVNEWAHEQARLILSDPKISESRRELAFYIADITKETSQQIRKENNWEDMAYKTVAWVDKDKPYTYQAKVYSNALRICQNHEYRDTHKT
jgi:hypothetical protein